MWLARLFGGRKVKAKRPARIAPRISDHPTATKGPLSAGSAKRGIHADKGAKHGFDPYNSGSFERNNAWERVIRR